MNDRFLRACRLEPVDKTPVWFMRQAGRYMSEYRELRQKYSLIELCQTPDLATIVTLQPVKSIDVDAAIIFSDLLLPLSPMGIQFDFVKGEGPVIDPPIRSSETINQLIIFEPREKLDYVLKAIRQVRTELGNNLPLIGFAGAPFTLASYAIEGGHSNGYTLTKTFMYSEPVAWHKLCEKLSTIIIDYLTAQIEAGVQAVQLFDSWVGALNPLDYREFILPHTQHILSTVGRLGVPVIHFGTGTAAILTEMREAGGDVIGIDWRIPLDHAWEKIGVDHAIQGNLDPVMLLGPVDRLVAGANDILKRADNKLGHIFNLGHGILPNTPIEHVQLLARYVHEHRNNQITIDS